MRFSLRTLLVAALASESVIASTWFPGSRTAYNKWHETELERWLADNNVPYPTPADRKDLEDLIKTNWNDKVVSPYNSWDANQASKYLKARGEDVKKGAEKNKDSLIAQIKSSWTDTEEKANEAYSSTRDWIFDSWTRISAQGIRRQERHPSSPTSHSRFSSQDCPRELPNCCQQGWRDCRVPW